METENITLSHEVVSIVLKPYHGPTHRILHLRSQEEDSDVGALSPKFWLCVSHYTSTFRRIYLMPRLEMQN